MATQISNDTLANLLYRREYIARELAYWLDAWDTFAAESTAGSDLILSIKPIELVARQMLEQDRREADTAATPASGSEHPAAPSPPASADPHSTAHSTPIAS